MTGELTDWPEKAQRLAERFPLSFLHPSACRWVDSIHSPVGLACSGGADSLCLLLLLWAHFPKRREDFLVLHFDHRLRGQESRADALFVADVVRALGLKGSFGSWERSQGETAVSEEAAREARFAFFRGELAGGERRLLILGHQRDDIVESHLMRLSRGSGAAGLSAPRPVHEFLDGRVHLRPLLTIAGVAIRRALEELGIPYRIDASNATPGFYRNRLRLEVLPLWQKHSPFNVSAGAAASRELLQEDDEALLVWLRELMPGAVPGQSLDLRPLATKPIALWRRALSEWLGTEGLIENLSKAAFGRLLEAAVEGRALKMSAGGSAFIELSSGRIITKRESNFRAQPVLEEAWPLPPNGTLLLPGRRSLQARFFPLDPETRKRVLAGQVESRIQAFAAWDGEIVWARSWRPGDRYRALGAPGSRKLQDMFVDIKLPEGERYQIPVVCACSEVLWAPCLPPAENSKINNLTKAVVQLTYDWGEAV